MAGRPDMTIRCNTCNYLFSPDPKRTVGCLCDSDAPTWIGVSPDGKVITMSYADYKIEG